MEFRLFVIGKDFDHAVRVQATLKNSEPIGTRMCLETWSFTIPLRAEPFELKCYEEWRLKKTEELEHFAMIRVGNETFNVWDG